MILGGGPAGVGAAYQLRVTDKASALLLEQNAWLGGNAGTFEWQGQRLDFGSHRLHPACEPNILADIRVLLGGDLLDRPRHGRIRLLRKWIHFPLKPMDLLLRLDPRFTGGMLGDTLKKRLRRRAQNGSADTFASVLRENLGATMCERFYFPYSRKLWGREPEELSGIQARRRVSAGTVLKLVRKVLNAVPGLKKPGSGRFFYPRHGYGTVTEAFARAAQQRGARILLEHKVTQLKMPEGDGPWIVAAESGGRVLEFEADDLWSTLPLTLIPRLIAPAAPPQVQQAAAATQFRAMLLIYLRLPVEQFTEFDAHYFPESDVAITRLSEPKNYSDLRLPGGATTLCAELPCAAGDRFFSMSEAELAGVVAEDLKCAGIPLPTAPTAVKVMRLAQAYPIYLNGYEQPLAQLQSWLETLPRFLSFGRQGLFAHDNTHHALAMAYGAVDCLSPQGFSRARWADYRKVFATHVVED